MIDIGRGQPIVLVPGVQGRWEWMKPAVDALAARARVITFSLCGERGSGWSLDSALGFDVHVRQIDAALDRAGVERAVICGVSYGGVIAVRYAAERPDRTSALVLVSAPGPVWRPDSRLRRQLAAPWMTSPLFVAGSFGRLHPELAATFPSRLERAAFALRHLWRVGTAPASPARMARRVKLWLDHDAAADCARVVAPTLILTGEPHLDRVVPVQSTHQYLHAIEGAAGMTLERSGHIGLVTRAGEFADRVVSFAAGLGGGPRAVARNPAVEPLRPAPNPT